MTDMYIRGARNGVNAWECDENDHLNVRFYMARLSESYGFIAHDLGVPRDHALVPHAHHVRFRQELRTGDMIEMRSRPLALRENTVIMHHEMLCAGELSATFISLDALVTQDGGQPAAWSSTQQARLQNMIAPIPTAQAPRSIQLEERLPEIDLRRAEELGMVEIYRGQVQPSQCAVQGGKLGGMAPEWVIGRFSDGVGNLWESLGLGRERMLDLGRGAVVLETRLNYEAQAPAGSLLVARSALIEVMPKTLRFAHLLFDLATGACIASSEVIVALLDHTARKTVGFTADELAMLTPLAKRLGSESITV